MSGTSMLIVPWLDDVALQTWSHNSRLQHLNDNTWEAMNLAIEQNLIPDLIRLEQWLLLAQCHYVRKKHVYGRG